MQTKLLQRGAVGIVTGITFWAVAAWANAAPPATSASTDTKPRTTVQAAAQEKQSFVGILEMLSRRYGVAFVTEDQPIAESVPSTTVAEALNSANSLSGDEAMQKAVESIAVLFDYTAVRQGGVFLLNKRYKQTPGEIPSVTFAECVAALRDTNRAVGALSPHIDSFHLADGLCGHLMTTLTQDQLSAMYNGERNVGNTVGGKPPRGVSIEGVPVEGDQQKSSKGTVELGLPIRSLTPSQRADVLRIAMYYFIQYPLDDMQYEALHLESAANPAAVFHYEAAQLTGFPAGRVLACVVPTPANKAGAKKEWHALFTDYNDSIGKKQVPEIRVEELYRRYAIVGVAGGLIGKRIDDPDVDAFIAKMQADERASDAAGSKAIKDDRKRRENGVSQTLAQAANWLNARPSLSGSVAENGKVSVDPMLASKRVTLVGVDTLSNLTVWTNIARLYDLATRELPDRSVYLTRPRQKNAREVAEVPDAMKNVLPGPLRRLTKYEQQAALGQEAQRRFHVIAKQAALASPTGEFRLNDLGEEGQQYLALYLLSYNGNGIRAISRLADPVPPFIANFDDRLLIGGLYIAPDGKTKFSLSFAKEDNPGALSQGPGFGNVIYKR